MNKNAQLTATMWLMVIVQTIGALDLPGHVQKGAPVGAKTRKLPAPRTYVAVAVLWSIFGLIADAGQAKAAVSMAWVTTLTAIVLGPVGATLVGTTKNPGGFLGLIAKNFSTAPPTPQGTVST